MPKTAFLAKIAVRTGALLKNQPPYVDTKWLFYLVGLFVTGTFFMSLGATQKFLFISINVDDVSSAQNTLKKV